MRCVGRSAGPALQGCLPNHWDSSSNSPLLDGRLSPPFPGSRAPMTQQLTASMPISHLWRLYTGARGSVGD